MTYFVYFFDLDFLGFFLDFFRDFLSIFLNRSAVAHGNDMSLIIVILYFNYKAFKSLNTLLL
jgi:hypothetical protein